MAGALNHRDLSPAALAIVLRFVLANTLLSHLPIELLDQISAYIHPIRITPLALSRTAINLNGRHPALTPPINGRCMIQELPSELRRELLASFLPNKDKIIRPLCLQHAPKQDPKRVPRRNAVSDLMLLSKKFKEDVIACVYRERFFGIHVHEGIYSGGIEFLDTGRQPLHYKESISDTRFLRFDDGEFGFSQLKKIEITIHPSTEDGRHNAMTTHYMNHALVRMLERSGKDDRIVSLTIQFADSAPGRAEASNNCHQIARNEHIWWSHEKDQPRCTSINGISDVELALRPFAMLTTVHDVRIYLPTKVKSHEGSVRFKSDLEQSMKSNTILGTLGPNDKLDHYAAVMRGEIENFIFHNKYGYKDDEVPDLTEAEYFEDEIARAKLANDGDDDDDHGHVHLTEEDYAEDRAAREAMKRVIEIGEDGNDDDDDDLLFVGMRPSRSRNEEYGGEEYQQKDTSFAGNGHMLGGSKRSQWASRFKYQRKKQELERTITKDVSIEKADGTFGRRVAFTDTRDEDGSIMGLERTLRTFQRGVSALDVDNLDISNEEVNMSKALKRSPEDSPGRSRGKFNGEFVDLTGGDEGDAEDDDEMPTLGEPSSLDRLREARLTRFARPASAWGESG